MRAVLDTNVLVSALISREGAPAGLIRLWLNGAFELVVSELLLAELSRALAYPKIRSRVSTVDASGFLQLLREAATVAVDPPVAQRHSRDRGDDYLLGLAQSTMAIVVSGDQDLLALAPELPVLAPADFLARLTAGEIA